MFFLEEGTILKVVVAETSANEVFTMPRIAEKAPSFKAVTTQGEINFPSDYSGKWIILLVILPILPLFVLLSL